MNFPKALRVVRESLGLTQMELNKTHRVNHATIKCNGQHLHTPVIMNAITIFPNGKGIMFECEKLEAKRSACDGY